MLALLYAAIIRAAWGYSDYGNRMKYAVRV